MKNMSFPPVVFGKFLIPYLKNWNFLLDSLTFFRIKKKPNLPFGKPSFFWKSLKIHVQRNSGIFRDSFKYFSLKIKPRNDFQQNILQSHD